MTQLKTTLCTLWLMAMMGVALPAWAGVVVVGHAALRKLDLPTVQRIYAGKVIEVDGVAVRPVNLQTGQPLRHRFLSDYLQQNEDTYLAYWTVRRYVGKGVPPREVGSVAELIQYVTNTPGAIAYLDDNDVPAGMNILLRK